jgi:hypothetical protein
MTKRVAVQEILRRVRADKDVDYIVVYKLSQDGAESQEGRHDLPRARRLPQRQRVLRGPRNPKTLKECDSKEENLLDLGADGSVAKEKLRTRLTEIMRQRTRVPE